MGDGTTHTLWFDPPIDHQQRRHQLTRERVVDEALAVIANGFTHYRLKLQPLRWRDVALRAAVGDNDDLRWVAHDGLASLGIPAPIRTLLESG